MFVLFGSPRSGTTLLKEMLCQHSGIIVPHETDFIIPISFILDCVKDELIGKKLISELIYSTKDFHFSIGRYLNKNEINEIIYNSPYKLSDILIAIYSSIAKKSGAILAGDKSPNDLGFVSILKKVGFFDSKIKIVHLIRDVRDVILSLRNTEWAPNNIQYYFPRIWAGSNLNLQLFASQGDSPYLRVRYEDLLEEPSLELENICNFLDLSFEERMCNFEQYGKELRYFDHHNNLGQPIFKDRAYSWKKCKDIELIKLCAQSANYALSEFGYES
jgi:hypothetical protein